MQKKSNSILLRELIESNGLTQKRAAELISQETIKPCPERTIRRWLAKPGSKCISECPDWPIIALRIALEKLRKIA